MLLENLFEAITSILANKMRSLLTMLGIIIGISSVIMITTIGSSLKGTINTSMNSLGISSVTVYLQANYDWGSGDAYPSLDEDDFIPVESVERLIQKYPNEITGIVEEIAVTGGTIRRDEEHYARVAVVGETEAAIENAKIKFAYGRNLTEEDSRLCKKVAIIPDRAAQYYFGNDINPIGQIVDVEMGGGEGSCQFTIVGVYQFNQSMFYSAADPRETNYGMFIPIGTAKKLTNFEAHGYEDFQLMIDPGADYKKTSEKIQDYFDELYADNQDWNVEVYSPMEGLKIINVVINVVTIAISIIAAISLIVGGVGVMNIMLVSITERTREIGVRMAMGATQGTIRTQFIIEAIVLCIIGGIFGIIVGIAGGAAIGLIAKIVVTNFFTDYADLLIVTIQPSFVAIMISIFFSALTGVFFGFYPANKAAKMEVIDALRYE